MEEGEDMDLALLTCHDSQYIMSDSQFLRGKTERKVDS